MAKHLQTVPPTSSVAKLLEPGIGAAATRPLASQPPRPANPGEDLPAATRPALEQDIAPAAGRQTGEPADIKREFTLTRGTDDTLSELLALYQRTTGCRLHSSHLMRALLRVVREAMPELEREAKALGRLRRPSNATGREAERDEFEERIAESLRAAFLAAKPPTCGR
jgi:uncharacterized protein YbjT (DUF2867 family)